MFTTSVLSKRFEEMLIFPKHFHKIAITLSKCLDKLFQISATLPKCRQNVSQTLQNFVLNFKVAVPDLENSFH